VTKKQLDAVRANLKAPQDFYNKLSDEQCKMLSGGALNFFHAIQHWSESEKVALARKNALRSKLNGGLTSMPLLVPNVEPSFGPVQVSDPATDFGLSSGFTQSATSTAWCGHNVVVAYNDSGAIGRAALPPTSKTELQWLLHVGRSG